MKSGEYYHESRAQQKERHRKENDKENGNNTAFLEYCEQTLNMMPIAQSISIHNISQQELDVSCDTIQHTKVFSNCEMCKS